MMAEVKEKYSSRCLVIAEAGVNHNGNEHRALEMVEAAADCGADAIKFQTFTAHKLVRRGARTVAYQERATGEGDQYSMLKKLELSSEAYSKIVARCDQLGLEFMSTPFDEEAVDFLLGLGMRRLKVPSGELTNHPFLRYLSGKNIPLILSTGMAAMEEVLDAVSVIESERLKNGFGGLEKQSLTILHCTSCYPAEVEEVNLRAMTTIAHHTGLPVGYSDHTLGTTVAIAAVASGACVLEKHFTLDRGLSGPDHSASLEPNELAEMIRQIRLVEIALGSSVKQPTERELAVRDGVRRSVTIVRSVAKGETIHEYDVALMRPGIGIEPKFLSEIVGRKAARNLDAHTTLHWCDLL